MKIIWSPSARRSFDNLIAFLELKWEPAVIIKLFNELGDSLKLIGGNPYLFPIISHKMQIRKCVLRKRTILLYRINERSKSIELILFIDGRVNPLKYKL